MRGRVAPPEGESRKAKGGRGLAAVTSDGVRFLILGPLSDAEQRLTPVISKAKSERRMAKTRCSTAFTFSFRL